MLLYREKVPYDLRREGLSPPLSVVVLIYELDRGFCSCLSVWVLCLDGHCEVEVLEILHQALDRFMIHNGSQ